MVDCWSFQVRRSSLQFGKLSERDRHVNLRNLLLHVAIFAGRFKVRGSSLQFGKTVVWIERPSRESSKITPWQYLLVVPKFHDSVQIGC